MHSLPCESFELHALPLNAFSWEPIWSMKGSVRLNPGYKGDVMPDERAVVAVEMEGNVLSVPIRIVAVQRKDDDLSEVSFVNDGVPFGDLGFGDGEAWNARGINARLYIL